MRADCCTAAGQIKPWQQNVKRSHRVFVSSAGSGHGPVSTCETLPPLPAGWAATLPFLRIQLPHYHRRVSTSVSVTFQHMPCQVGETRRSHTPPIKNGHQPRRNSKSEMHSVAVGRVRQGLKLKLQWRDKFTSHRILLFSLKKKERKTAVLCHSIWLPCKVNCACANLRRLAAHLNRRMHLLCRQLNRQSGKFTERDVSLLLQTMELQF